MTSLNPLLDFSGLPRFEAITPEHVAPAITQILAENRALLARLSEATTPATWRDFVLPLVDASERLTRAWGIVGHMHSVNDVPAWRDAYNNMLPEVTRYSIEQGQNPALFAQYQALAAGAEFATLPAVCQRIINNELRDYVLSGVQLPAAQQARFKAIQEELAALGAKFAENLQDATRSHAEWVTEPAELAGIPADAVNAARQAAEKEQRPGWKFTLHAPSYLAVMQYADHRALRARLYRAYATRAAEMGPAERDNSPVMARIVALRQEAAHLLGYANYAEVSLASKMAETPAEVAAFLRDLAKRARPYAERDLHELTDFACKHLGLQALESWDLAWVSEKLKQARYAFSDDEVRQYFPEARVLNGLFRIIERLFGVQISAGNAAAWHQEVRFYQIKRQDKLIGEFYIDLYARDTKRGGAWMDEARCRRYGGQTPVAYLNCNFAAPLPGKPATFTHDEVITLFHETGHGLHHLLTEVEELWASGIRGVEWDAVELPSQFMENFCWEWEVLSDMAAHVTTGAPLGRDLFDKMLAAKNFQGGLFMLRQLEFSLFDLLLHSEFDATSNDALGIMDLLDTVRHEIAVVIPPPWQRFAQSFSHIFDGGYGAGYYSYKWAEVLSADAYAAFEEAAAQHPNGSVIDSVIGARFWQEILAVGGSRPAMASFIAFRGRPPQADALLRHSGMMDS